MGWISLGRLQKDHALWLEHNFPGQKPHQPLLGLQEEVGELAHAHLKGEQGIRHDPEEIFRLKKDAVGDIVIYLASYCTANSLDLDACVYGAWQEVKARDWQAHKKEGVA